MKLTNRVLPYLLLGVAWPWLLPLQASGRLWEPPGRSTMWRRNYPTLVNYNDDKLSCGGLVHHVSQGYRCGLCGDPFDGPRDHEDGGMYDAQIVSRIYTQGQDVTFLVDITQGRPGYFEFKLCPKEEVTGRVTQDCLDRHPIQMAGGSNLTRFVLDENTPVTHHMVDVQVQLPPDLNCTVCVLQWKYHTANRYGTNANGTSCMGCGMQEEFYACADIQIVPITAPGEETSVVTMATTPSSPATTRNFQSTTSQSAKSTEPSNSNTTEEFNATESTTSTTQVPSWDSPYAMLGSTIQGEKLVCKSTRSKGMSIWCQMNCQSGHCPPHLCECTVEKSLERTIQPEGCRGAGPFGSLPGYDGWCLQHCFISNCPVSLCICD